MKINKNISQNVLTNIQPCIILNLTKEKRNNPTEKVGREEQKNLKKERYSPPNN